MKKCSILLLLCLILNSVINAKDYRKVKIGLGVGYTASGPAYAYGRSRNGLLITLEPAFNVDEKLSIGMRLELAAFGSGNIDNIDGGISYTLNGQYYLSDDHGFRPFMGVGFGIYNFDTHEDKIGVYPRLGFDAGHFNMAVEYNFIEAYNKGNGSNDSYFGIRIGVFFGGGKKQTQVKQ